MGAPVASQPPELSVTTGEFDKIAGTDREGRFILEDLEAGEHFLSAGAPGYHFAQLDRIAAGTTGVTPTLRRMAEVRGQVVERGTRRPVPGATLGGYGVPLRLGEHVAQARSDPDGGFILVGLPAGTWMIQARAACFALAEKEIEIGPEQVVAGLVLELAPGGGLRGQILSARSRGPVAVPAEDPAATVDLIMEQGLETELLVLDAQRNPVAGARVTLRDPRSGVALPVRSRLPSSNDQGVLRLCDLRAGTYQLAVTAPDQAPHEELVDISEGVAALVVVMETRR